MRRLIRENYPPRILNLIKGAYVSEFKNSLAKILRNDGPVTWGRDTFDNVDDLYRHITSSGRAMSNELRNKIFKNLDDVRLIQIFTDEMVTNPSFIRIYGNLTKDEAIDRLRNLGYSDTHTNAVIKSYERSGGSFLSGGGGRRGPRVGESKLARYWRLAGMGIERGNYISAYRAYRDRKYDRLFNWFMFGTTRTRQEFNKLLAGLPLSEKIPVLIISLGREAVKRYLKTAFYATSFNWVVGHLIDYSKQGKEYQSENALINEANRFIDSLYMPSSLWVFPSYEIWKNLLPHLMKVITPLSQGDLNEAISKSEQEYQTLMDEEEGKFMDYTDEMVSDLYNEAGALSSKLKQYEDGSYYLGNENYPVYYDDKYKMWLVSFPDGNAYNIKDLK